MKREPHKPAQRETAIKLLPIVELNFKSRQEGKFVKYLTSVKKVERFQSH